MKSRAALALTCLLLSSASAGCERIEGTQDPESLGYGSAATGKTRYDPAPMLPRRAPVPWTPPAQSFGSAPGGSMGMSAAPPTPFSPEVIQLCTQLEGLEGPEDLEPADPRAAHRCRSRLRGARVFRAQATWRAYVTCLQSAEAPEAVAACDAAHPPLITALPDHPRESAACMHIFAMTAIEEFGASPELGPDDITDFTGLMRGCVETFFEDAEDPTYDARLECLLDSVSTVAAQAC